MTPEHAIDAIVAEAGWGFHDASLVGFQVAYDRRELTFDLLLAVDERQTMQRPGRLTITGLVYMVVEPPDASYKYAEPKALWIDTGDGVTGARSELPPTGDGNFTWWIFVQDWNSFIRIAGRDARFEWTGAERPHVRASHGFALPGDEIA